MDYFEGLPIQQSLGIKISDKDDFATFEVGRNANTIKALTSALDNQSNEFFFVFGPSGCGKTHLLKALFQKYNANLSDCLMLDCNLLKQLGAMALEVNIPKVVLLDNVDIIAGDEDLELGLFGFFNRWYDKGTGTLIMASKKSFDQIGFIKKDLNTRLSSGVSLSLDYLNEEECVEALLKRSKARFVNLPKRTVEFLVRHCNHDMRSLLKVMDKLENAQIEHTHELTIPFVKKILNLN